ncbi:VacJ family lipoprotein [Parashewanella curva]|uniref:VacJ family lipoprotein n=1 Tax=Parashewanella curva TaxID=2338552 RepID=A0A3L8Q1X7_9GAMM|nr:VacJ family lipoprotein [Parashewanella curva]RLV61594.1 VacJ family lipoprotein [Parashewanella curva]
MGQRIIFVCLLILTLGTGCTSKAILETNQAAQTDNVSTSKSSQPQYNDDRDPFEGFNRAMWNFNYNYLDKYVLKPVAHSYNDYVPSPIKTGVVNFVENLDEPSSLLNNTLQGKWKNAATSGGRFIINSTIGLLGLVDVAEMMGISAKQESFSEVVGYYGVPDGPYFMLPAYGPKVTRELATDWVDDLYFPLAELSTGQNLIRVALKGLNARVAAIPQERLLDNSLDPYSFVKNAYLQNVQFKLHDGKVPQNQGSDDVDAYLDELD